jgi:spermidine dehydrogenase
MDPRKTDATLGLDRAITRRDFLNGALIASGSALLGPGTPLQMLAQLSGNDWDGYGGVGEYRNSHGNPWEVVQAAHQIRDGAFDESPRRFKFKTQEKSTIL